MAFNKNALIRYRTIDKCLQNRYRKWTLDDLIAACSDALYEYEGKDVNVSKRAVQADIQLLRSDKLGYNAPIVVYDRKYYKYETPDFSITNNPLTATDMNVLSEAVEMLKQFKDFSLFSDLSGIIQRLEDTVYSEKTKEAAIIHFDKNENLKGLHYLDSLYRAILKKQVVRLTYQSFKAREVQKLLVHPFILKEYNNRWFLVGKRDSVNGNILTLALDRIESVEIAPEISYQKKKFDAEKYYADTYGVTVLSKKNLMLMEFKINGHNAPYVLTKPFHHSQKLLETYSDRSIRISIEVHHNFEIERLILGFGAGIEVLQPSRLRRRIKWLLKKTMASYEVEDN